MAKSKKKKSLLKSLALLGLLSTVFAGIVAYPHVRHAIAIHEANKAAAVVVKPTATAAQTPIELMSSAVRIQVDVEFTRLTTKKGKTIETPGREGWSGSGVVYDKTDRAKGPVRSRILSANHVLETPEVGSIKDDVINFFGMEMNLGKKRIDAVKITLQTADGRTCNVKALALGSTDQHDTATAEADCDAGRVAELGTAMPVMGQKVFVAGYSLGVKLPMLTEGYVSGWMDGYLLTSAPAYGGNSGGPVFHDGKVIGLLVRGSPVYPNLTLTASLEECLRRIAETPPLN